MSICVHCLSAFPRCICSTTVQGRQSDLDNYYGPSLADKPELFTKETTYPGQKLHMEPKENILQEADRLVSGDRQESYKHPIEDYECTATMWSAMIKKRYGVDIELTPDFCCLMMASMKISREAGKHKRDNLVDGAGYLRCAEMCLEGSTGII